MPESHTQSRSYMEVKNITKEKKHFKETWRYLGLMIFDEALDVYERLGMPFQQGNRIMRFSPFNAYPTEDGWVVIGIGHDAMWRALCTLIEREDLAHDPDWGRMDWRVEHNAQVDEMLSEWTRDRPIEPAVAALESTGIVASPVQNIDDLLDFTVPADNRIEFVCNRK